MEQRERSVLLGSPQDPVRRTTVLGIPVDAAETLGCVVELIRARLDEGTQLLVTFVNPSAVMIARQRPDYVRQLGRFDAVLPDGGGMSATIRLLHRIPAMRISFDTTSLAPEVMAMAAARRKSVVLVGGMPGSAERAAARLLEAFPQLRIPGCYDGYGDIGEKIGGILELRPDIVVCGMGAGAQEDLLLALSDRGWCGCGFTCGGYFDQLAERLAYYPAWVDRLNLRWAYRLAREPRRLWRRYCLGYPMFIAALLLAIPGTWWRSGRLGATRFGAGMGSRSGSNPSTAASRTGALNR